MRLLIKKIFACALLFIASVFHPTDFPLFLKLCIIKTCLKWSHLPIRDSIPNFSGQMLPFNTSKIEGHNTTAAIIKCQKICNNTTGCQFFIYKDHTYDHHFNKSENLCELWNHTLSDYEAGCVQLGGPLSPASVEHCQNITNNISSCEVGKITFERCTKECLFLWLCINCKFKLLLS